MEEIMQVKEDISWVAYGGPSFDGTRIVSGVGDGNIRVRVQRQASRDTPIMSGLLDSFWMGLASSQAQKTRRQMWS